MRKRGWQLILALALVLLVAIPAWADDGRQGIVRFGEDLVVRPGERVRGDAVVFGANALVQSGGLIAGDLAVMGGSATIQGEVLGDVAAFGGNVDLQEGCLVSGDVVSFGGAVHQASGARVQGQVLSGFRWPGWQGMSWPWRGLFGEPEGPVQGRFPFWTEAALAGLIGLVRGVIGALISALLLAGLAILTMLFLPRHTRQVAACVETAWPASLGVGILAFARLTSFAPALVVLFFLGVVLAPIDIAAGPLILHATPKEFVGRVMAVITPSNALASIVSTAIAGSLASTVLHGFHATLLGIALGPIDTIFTGTAILVTAGGLYAMVGLRGVKLASAEAAPAAAASAAAEAQVAAE